MASSITQVHAGGQMNGVNAGLDGTVVTEQKMLERVVGRLVADFGDLGKDRVVGVVHQEHSVFADRRVREFVPVLVERVARRRLACDRPQAQGEQGVQGRVELDGEAAATCRPGRCWECLEA